MPPDPADPKQEPRLFFYGEPAQLPILRATLASLGASMVGCGSQEPAASAELSEQLKVDREDDLRCVVQRDDYDVLLIGSPPAPGSETISTIRACPAPVVTLEPLPGSFEYLLGGGAGESPAACVAPLFRYSPGVKTAQSFLAEFGPPHAVNIVMRFDPGSWSLFSRLYDALDMAASLIGDCEQIHAAVAGANARPAETLRGMQGDMTVHLCGSDQRNAVISLHETPGAWFRGMTVNSSSGFLRITDLQCEHAEEPEDAVFPPEVPVVDLLGELIAADIRRTLDDSALTPHNDAHARTFALCEAARVSCRTGGGESILRFLEMVGSV